VAVASRPSTAAAGRVASLLASALVLALALPPANAQSPRAAPDAPSPVAQAASGTAAGAATTGVAADAGEFLYRTRAGDTLIGLAARLLREPRRWPELQARNRIAEPRRMPRGSLVRIPYDWLRVTRQSARVVERVGAVTADGRALDAGASLDAGAILETGPDGSVTLELVDGSVLVLKPSSRLRLERLQRVDGAGADEALLQLDRGKLETEVKPRGDMGRFEIRTPAAVSAVRGTGFRASFAEATASATTETLDGAVAVSGSGAGVAVRAGFGTRADQGQPPRPPVPLLPAPALAGLPALNDRATLRWQFAPVAGAAAYRHQLARDPAFRALVADLVTPGPASELPDLPDGRYWLRVRAIDGAAIEGFDATAEIEQRRRLDAPTARSPVGGAKRLGDRTRFDWAAQPGAAGYQFQLAAEASFASPLAQRSVDAAPAAGAPGAAADVGAGAGVELAALAPGRYWWRVAAVDALGVVGHWGEAQAFKQKPPPVAAEPIAAARLDGARTQTFRWAATEAGQQYDWQLAADPAFRRLLRSGRSASPELRLEALPYGAHYLRVRAIDADGFTAPFGPASRVEVPVPTWVWFLTPAILLIPAL
jgi:hypothetical protein